MEVIITALIAGVAEASKDTVGNVIKEGYAELKALLKKRFADKNKAEDSDILDKVEKKPDSKAVKALLEEELAEIEADKDEEIIKLAQDIMKEKDPEGFKKGEYNINISGGKQGVVGNNSGTVNM